MSYSIGIRIQGSYTTGSASCTTSHEIGQTYRASFALAPSLLMGRNVQWYEVILELHLRTEQDTLSHSQRFARDTVTMIEACTMLRMDKRGMKYITVFRVYLTPSMTFHN